VIRRNYPVAIGGDTAHAETEQVTVVGCLCTPLDLLADDVALPRADIGDLFVIFQAGAYGLTASPTAFLGHPAPVEVLV
jgi:diaminopimelate decarboxylase